MTVSSTPLARSCAAALVLLGCSAAPREYVGPEAVASEPRPDRVLAWTHPATLGLGSLSIELVEIEVEPGIHLRGVCARPGHYPTPVVLLLPGSGPRLTRDPDGQELIEVGPFWSLVIDGFGVLAVDYRGCGDSDGRFHRQHVRADAMALWQEAVRLAGRPEAVVVRASSLGTLAVDELLRAGIEPAAIVALAPDEGAELERPAGVRWLRRDDVDPDELATGEMELYGRAFPTMGFARWYPPACALRDFRIPVLEVPNFASKLLIGGTK